MECFKLIGWPQIQDYMELDGFESNSTLVNSNPSMCIDGSTYLVKKSWLREQGENIVKSNVGEIYSLAEEIYGELYERVGKTQYKFVDMQNLDESKDNCYAVSEDGSPEERIIGLAIFDSTLCAYFDTIPLHTRTVYTQDDLLNGDSWKSVERGCDNFVEIMLSISDVIDQYLPSDSQTE